MAEGASLVCSVESTRWPVSADSTAICAVSRSRISPTMITSGSALIIERRPEAKVSPPFFETCSSVSPVEGRFEALALDLSEAQLLELGDVGVLVEHAQHDRLAVNAGQRDRAQVDAPAVDRQADAAVLGP